MRLASLTENKLAAIRRDAVTLCRALLRLLNMPQVFALRTALELQGIEVPQLPRSLRKCRLMLVVDTPKKRHWMLGRKWVCWSGPCEVVDLGEGIQCTNPVCTWAMFSSWLDLGELVQLGDALMRRNPRLRKVSMADFHEYLRKWERYVSECRSAGSARRTFRGIAKCRRALRLMCPGTDSMPETMTRLTLQRYGVERAVVNWVVRGADGHIIAILDNAYVGAKTDVEYNGNYHKNQPIQDAKRTGNLKAAGWEVVTITKEDLANTKSQYNMALRVVELLNTRDPKYSYTVRKKPLTLWEVSDARRTRWKTERPSNL